MKILPRPFRRLIVASLLLQAPLAGCKPPPPPPPPPAPPPAPKPPTVAETVDTIFAAYFAANPVTATALGEHAYDAQWPDLSPEGLDAERARIATARSALDQAGIANVDDEVDVEILRNALDLQAFSLDVEQPWRTDPYWYVGLIGAGIDELISRDFAPAGDRAASVAARLVGLPAIVEQAKVNLDAAACMRPQTEVAIAQIDGLVTLIRKTTFERLADAPEPVRQQIGAASSPAVMALRDLQQHLRSTVLPAAAGDWRLGKENFEQKLQLVLDSDVKADSLRRAAVMEHGRVRKAMNALAYDLGVAMIGERKLARVRRRAVGDPDAAVTRYVLDILSNWHVDPPTLRDAAEENLTRLDAFVSSQDILPLDSSEVLQVIWTPPHQQGVFIAGLAAPGPLETTEAGLPSFYLVQPIPKTWEPEVTESFLREYNNFMLEILSIHEAIPGHFVQLYYGKREPSKVRKVLQNGAFVEGWAVYTESVMVDAGYAGRVVPPEAERPDGVGPALWSVITTPELHAKAIALHGLKFYLRTVTNAILDHSIHAGTMTREEALDLMINRSYQGEGEAVGKWTRAQLTSAQLSTYFAGARAWRALRTKAEARGGFSASTFHAEALAHGAPPVDALPRLMGWTGEATAESAQEPATEPDAEADVAIEETVEPETEPAPAEAAADDFDSALDDVLGD
ncbi:MAG: DUF885 domain-containing protein [Myxococcota bacterium]